MHEKRERSGECGGGSKVVLLDISRITAHVSRRTLTALLKMTNDILCALGGGDVSGLDPFVILSSVFNAIAHHVFSSGFRSARVTRPATVSFRGPVLFIIYSPPLFSLVETFSFQAVFW